MSADPSGLRALSVASRTGTGSDASLLEPTKSPARSPSSNFSSPASRIATVAAATASWSLRVIVRRARRSANSCGSKPSISAAIRVCRLDGS
jgi:hypothetical protein